MHPHIVSNKPSPTTFEEVQFFSGSNYLKGIDWYMNFFPIPDEKTVMFEKSATYFTNPLVPKRLSALLPNKHIIVVLTNPADRAYSWYQHMKSHGDPTATTHTFHEIIRSKKKSSTPSVTSLQHHCLDPGLYAFHIENWMEYVSPKQIIIVDGEKLKDNPAEVMYWMQRWLGIKQVKDYKKMLKFDKKKGFFCQVQENGRNKCLGKSKGRKYPEMEQKTREYLDHYYREPNKRLYALLDEMDKPKPSWLVKQISKTEKDIIK